MSSKPAARGILTTDPNDGAKSTLSSAVPTEEIRGISVGSLGQLSVPSEDIEMHNPFGQI
jgi:hypothetical protein